MFFDNRITTVLCVSCGKVGERMTYTREDLFTDMADNIVRDCKEIHDELREAATKVVIIDRLRRLAELIDNGDI